MRRVKAQWFFDALGGKVASIEGVRVPNGPPADVYKDAKGRELGRVVIAPDGWPVYYLANGK